MDVEILLLYVLLFAWFFATIIDIVYNYELIKEINNYFNKIKEYEDDIK